MSPPPVRVIHRDIKLSNIVVKKVEDNLVLKLCDFGTSRPLDQSMEITRCGTYRYTAPELMNRKLVNENVDTYSFSMVFYEMIHRQRVFLDLDEIQVVYTVLQGGRPTVLPDLPKKISLILLESWQDDPDNRPSVFNIVSKLNEIIKDQTCLSKLSSFLAGRDNWIRSIAKTESFYSVKSQNESTWNSITRMKKEGTVTIIGIDGETTAPKKGQKISENS